MVCGGSSNENDLTYYIVKAVGINTNNAVTSYGQTVDMTGNWDWQENVGGQISKYDDIIKATAKRLDLDWRLCSALCFVESTFDTNAENTSSTASGLWGILDGTWDYCHPNGCKEVKYKKDAEKSTLGFERQMGALLNRYPNAATRNDQIALAFQCYHDGSLANNPTEFVKRKLRNKDNKDSIQYVPTILNKYKEYCK